MLYAKGDLWDYAPTHWLVIPTNIGWTRDGRNVMGRGVAKQAAERVPALAQWYGELCRRRGAATAVAFNRWTISADEVYKLLLFPVKPLNLAAPWLSWQNRADLELIKRSTKLLSLAGTMLTPVALPLVGCGNGGLVQEDVLPILAAQLDDTFTLVELP